MSLSVKNTLGGGSIGAVENLLVPTLGTTTLNGVTCTNNGDGTYTLNGTASTRTYFNIMPYVITGVGITYKLVGCPKRTDSGEGDAPVFLDMEGGGIYNIDRGEGKIFTATRTKWDIAIVVIQGASLNNVTFKPMLTTNLKATYKEFVKRVGGFSNLLNPTWNTMSTGGITMTDNHDGTYTLNGTTGDDVADFIIYGFTFENGKQYKLTGCPKGGSSTTYRWYVRHATNNKSDFGNGVVFTADGGEQYLCIRIEKQQTINNLVFKPMLTESLLPEYFDFVKASGTRFARGTLTLSSATNKLFITHGLGVVPKAFAIYAVVSSYRSYTWNAFYDASYDTKAYVGRSNVVQAIQFNATESDTSYNFKDSNKIGVVQYSSSYAWQAGTYEWIAVG